MNTSAVWCQRMPGLLLKARDAGPGRSPRRTARSFRIRASLGVGLMALFVTLSSTLGQPVITTFAGGYLGWTNPASALNMYSVEWTHDLLSGAWQSQWDRQAAIVTTQEMISVPVPMAFRVAKGFDNRAFDGVWVVYYEDGHSFMKTDGKGLITAFGAYMLGKPVGYYSVASNGQFQMTLYDSEDGLLPVTGDRLDPLRWRYVFGTFTGLMQKVEDPGAMAGDWKGSIGEHANVFLRVRPDGFISIVSNLYGVGNGSMYVDRSNTVVAALHTGADPCTNAWNRIQIRGIRFGVTNIIGDYELDWDLGWITAGVHLQRK